MMKRKHEAATVAATFGEAMPRIEIVSDRRRSHGAAFRAGVVAECAAPGARVQDVAARHGICPSLIYRWRRTIAAAPPVAIFFYSRDRGREHPRRHLANLAGILQADAYGGYAELYHPARKPGPIAEATCWAHGRRKLFVLADVAKAPLAIEAVRRIDPIFDAERDINGLMQEQRLAMRRTVVTVRSRR